MGRRWKYWLHLIWLCFQSDYKEVGDEGYCDEPASRRLLRCLRRKKERKVGK